MRGVLSRGQGREGGGSRGISKFLRRREKEGVR